MVSTMVSGLIKTSLKYSLGDVNVAAYSGLTRSCDNATEFPQYCFQFSVFPMFNGVTTEISVGILQKKEEDGNPA